VAPEPEGSSLSSARWIHFTPPPTPTNLLKIHFDPILPSTPWSSYFSKVPINTIFPNHAHPPASISSLSRFQTKYLRALPTFVVHATCSTYLIPSWMYHPNSVCWRVRISNSSKRKTYQTSRSDTYEFGRSIQPLWLRTSFTRREGWILYHKANILHKGNWKVPQLCTCCYWCVFNTLRYYWSPLAESSWSQTFPNLLYFNCIIHHSVPNIFRLIIITRIPTKPNMPSYSG
jgi:hypothetical protein